MQSPTSSFGPRKKVVPKKTINGHSSRIDKTTNAGSDSLNDLMKNYSEDKENKSKSKEEASSSRNGSHQSNITRNPEEFEKLLKELETKNFLVEHLTIQLKQAQDTISLLKKQLNEEKTRESHSIPIFREQSTQTEEIESKVSHFPKEENTTHHAIKYEYQFNNLTPPLAISILYILFGKKTSSFTFEWNSLEEEEEEEEDKLILLNGECIFGRNAIIRYLIRKHSFPIYLFDTNSHVSAFETVFIDEFENILDILSSLRNNLYFNSSLQELEEILMKSSGGFFFGNQVSLADILIWESLKHKELHSNINYSEYIHRWYKSMDDLSICKFAVDFFSSKSTSTDSFSFKQNEAHEDNDASKSSPNETTLKSPKSPVEHSSVDFTFVFEADHQSFGSDSAFNFDESSSNASFPSSNSNPSTVFTNSRKFLKARRSKTSATDQQPSSTTPHPPPTTPTHPPSSTIPSHSQQSSSSESRRFVKSKRSLRTSQSRENSSRSPSSIPNASSIAEVDMTDAQDSKEQETTSSNQDADSKIPEKNAKEESQRYRDMGNKLYKEGKYTESLFYYNQAISSDPLNYLNYGNRAAALFMIGKIKECLSDCEKALDINPQYIKCIVRAGKCHIQLGNLDKAIECLSESEKLSGGAYDVKEDLLLMKQIKEKLNQAELFLQKENNQQALELLDSAIKRYPRSLDAHLLKAKVLLNMHEYQQLHSLLDILSSKDILHSKNLQIEVAYLRISALYKDGDLDSAKRLLEVSLKNSPNDERLSSIQKRIKNLELKKQQGNEAFSKENYKLAYQLYSEAIEIDTIRHFSKTLYSNRAAVSVKLENYKEALKDCNKAIELDPNFMKPVLRRSQIFITLEMYEHAVADLQKVLHADRNNGEVRHSLSIAQAALKKLEDKDYYSFLEVEKTASDDIIKKAYKKKALILHPDKNNDTPELKEHAEKWFKYLGEVYSTLSDPNKRNQYDLTLPFIGKQESSQTRYQETRKNKPSPSRNFSQKPKDKESTGDFRKKYQYY